MRFRSVASFGWISLLACGVVAPSAAAAARGVEAELAEGRRQQLYAGGGTVLLDQAPNGGCLLLSDVGGPQSLADDFTIGGTDAQTLSQLILTGGYLFTNVPPVDDVFTVNVHADDGGLPGASLCAQSGIAATRSATGRVVSGFDVFELTLDLDGSCSLAAGGPYWLEVYEESADGDEFSWECGDVDAINGIAGALLAPENPGVNWAVRVDDYALVILAGDPAPTSVGGSVTGVDPQGVLCSNLSTGQQITAPLAGTSWDCDALGLATSPGDTVLTGVRGTVE